MYAQIDPDTFTESLNPVKKLVDECKVHLTEDGLRIRAVDPANVGMVDLELQKTAFEQYQPPEDGGLIGLNLQRLLDKVNTISDQPLDDDIILEMELDSETRKLNLSGGKMSFSLALIDPDSIRQEPDIPDLDLPAEALMNAAWLNQGVTGADEVADYITLEVDTESDELVMRSEGDTDDWDMALDEHDSGVIDLAVGPANSMFSLDYLKDMSTAIPNDTEVTLRLGEEFPTKLNFGLAEGHATAEYMLAPRVESD